MSYAYARRGHASNNINGHRGKHPPPVGGVYKRLMSLPDSLVQDPSVNGCYGCLEITPSAIAAAGGRCAVAGVANAGVCPNLQEVCWRSAVQEKAMSAQLESAIRRSASRRSSEARRSNLWVMRGVEAGRGIGRAAARV